MWRDLGQYLQALWKYWASLLAGPFVTVLLLIWQVFGNANIPTWAFWVIAVPGVPIAGFLAWRDEHARAAAAADGQRLERERQDNARQLERERRDNALASKVADRYVEMASLRKDSGPHALATLGLHALGSEALIRQAIQEMEARSGTDPWGGAARYVETIDLVRFFTWVSENHPDFHTTSVADVAKQVKEASAPKIA
jgi:hypothetical protein